MSENPRPELSGERAKRPPAYAASALELPFLLTADEVAAVLRTSRKSIYEMARKGHLPGTLKIGRKVLFRRDRLLHFLRESSVSSLEEHE